MQLSYFQGLVFVERSVVMQATTKEELWEIFEKGSQNRHVASTSKSVTKILLWFILKLSRSIFMQTVLKIALWWSSKFLSRKTSEKCTSFRCWLQCLVKFPRWIIRPFISHSLWISYYLTSTSSPMDAFSFGCYIRFIHKFLFVLQGIASLSLIWVRSHWSFLFSISY